MDVSWVWVNDQSMVKVSNTMVPTDRAGDKSINIEAMNYCGNTSKTVKINSFEVEKDENNSIRNNSRQFGEIVRKIIYEQEIDTSDIAGLDILNEFIEMARDLCKDLATKYGYFKEYVLQ